MSRRAHTFVIAAASLTVAAPAQAATLVGDQSCYQENEPVNVTGTGFTPNGVVNFSRDNQSFGTLQADAVGNVRGAGAAPRITPALQRAFVLEARDATNPVIAASINPLATRFGVTITPEGGNPARTRRIKARGFTEGKTLYAHVRRGGKGKNIKLGKLKRPCGNKSVKKRLFRRGVKHGVYRVYFDTRRKYSRKTAQQKVFRVTIFQTFRPSLASNSAFGDQGERWVQSH